MNWGSGATERQPFARPIEAGATSIGARGLLGALLGLAALFALLAPTSQAAVEATRTYAPEAFFGGQGAEPGQFDHPGQIAIEAGTGNLLVADTGNGRVQVFSTDAAGNPSFLTTLGAGILVTPVGIAVDPATGAIYVSDSGAGQVFRFTSDGAATPTYTVDPTFTSPTLSSYASTLAVDPTTHDLLVADTGSQEVRRFDVADGSQLGAFDGLTSPGGQFSSLRSIAVGPSGRIYVADERYPEATYLESDGGRVEQFDAAGDPLGQLQGVSQEGTVGVDPVDGTALVGWQNQYVAPGRRVSVFEGSDSPAFSVDLSPLAGGTVGIAVSGADPHPAWVLTATIFADIGLPGIQPLKPADIPAAEVGAIGAIGGTSAHATGQVAPGTLSGTGTARFEYSLDGTTWTAMPDQGGIAGPGDTTISTDLTELRPNTLYSLRIHIANEDSAADSPVVTFSTSPEAPAVETSSVTDRTTTSAVLNGKVVPFGQQTTFHFEYGETASYGKSVPVGAEDVAGNGYLPRAVVHAISGLEPSTTYHWRLVAHNATGTSASPDATFTTRAASEPGRVYEQVTPVDKHGLVVGPKNSTLAEAAGNGIVYQVRHAYDSPETESSPDAARYASVRSPEGWELRQMDVPQAVSKSPVAPMFNASLAISADFSHALVGSDLKLAPGGVDGTGNLYRRDLATGALELVATGLSKEDTQVQTALSSFNGGTPDFSRIVFRSINQLTPLAGPFPDQIYEWSVDEGLRVISTLPGGSPPSAPSRGVVGGNWPARNSTSADVSRVYFTQGGELYVHEAGETVQVSPPGGNGATFLDATPDGRFVAYMDGGPPFGGRLYRYDRDTDTTVFVAPIQQLENFWGMSDDGSSIFTGDTSGDLHAWHEGALQSMATIEGNANVLLQGLAASPNGRYFVFAIDNLAGEKYDNTNVAQCGGRCREIQVYDVQDETLTCASCPADGRPPAGQAELSAGEAEFNGYGPPFVNDKGQVFFDTPTALVAGDINGRRDVYEYEDGEARLISPGTGEFDATLADVSANGDNVFFLTGEGLVGQDQDRRPDIYDARVGGGIASQSPERVAVCGGADCRAPVAAPVAAAGIASESVSGAVATGHRKAPHHKKKKRHHKKARHHGRKARHDKRKPTPTRPRDAARAQFQRTTGK